MNNPLPKKFTDKLIGPTSIFLGLTFFGAGMAKLYAEHQYFGWIGPVWLEEKLEPYGLGLYGRFIAYSQVIIGYLLFTLRYRLLGAIMAMPLIVNILMVTISQNWTGTPYVLVVLLLMNIFLIYKEGRWLVKLIGLPVDLTLSASPYSRRGDVIWISGLFLNLFSVTVSYYQIPLAWTLSILGMVLSFIAYRSDIGS